MFTSFSSFSSTFQTYDSPIRGTLSYLTPLGTSKITTRSAKSYFKKFQIPNRHNSYLLYWPFTTLEVWEFHNGIFNAHYMIIIISIVTFGWKIRRRISSRFCFYNIYYGFPFCLCLFQAASPYLSLDSFLSDHNSGFLWPICLKF